MKVCVTSKSFSKNAVLRDKLKERYPQAQFNEAGHTFNPQSLATFLKDCDKAIVGLEKVDAELLEQLPNLKIVSKYGVGLDNIDFEALKKKNVLFGYKPGTNKRGVAELALQMMLIGLRKSYLANLMLRKGEWTPQFGQNLTGKTVGILGLGNVGKDLVELLAPFQCEIYCHDIKPDQDFIKTKNLKHVSLKDLFAKSQIVSVHVPLNKTTQGLVDKDLLASMKNDGILINTARGGIVDESSLFQQLRDQKILAAGFDVFAQEPCLNKELLTLENFFCTPHIGGSSVESVLAMGMAAIEGLDSARPVSELDFI